MFRRRHEPPADGVTIRIGETDMQVPAGETVAAAVLAAGLAYTRHSPVGGGPRAPYCMMGVCFECLMEIDGVPNRQACMVRVRDGMTVRPQDGAREIG